MDFRLLPCPRPSGFDLGGKLRENGLFAKLGGKLDVHRKRAIRSLSEGVIKPSASR